MVQALFDPERFPPERQVRLVDPYIASLARPAPRSALDRTPGAERGGDLRPGWRPRSAPGSAGGVAGAGRPTTSVRPDRSAGRRPSRSAPDASTNRWAGGARCTARRYRVRRSVNQRRPCGPLSSIRRMDKTTPHTTASLADDLRKIGIAEGDVVLMYLSMKSLGFVVGGTQAVVTALLQVLGPFGTLVVPHPHPPDNCDPCGLAEPARPRGMVGDHPARGPLGSHRRTQSRWMGVLAETVRTWRVPGAAAIHRCRSLRSAPRPCRSSTATGSTTRWGRRRRSESSTGSTARCSCWAATTAPTPRCISRSGANPPRRADWSARLYAVPTGPANGSPGRTCCRTRTTSTTSAPTSRRPALSPADLAGNATAKLMSQRALVDFAAAWMASHR